MTKKRTGKQAAAQTLTRPTRRTQAVWVCFIVAMTFALAILHLNDRSADRRGFVVAASLTSIPQSAAATGGAEPAHLDPIFQISEPLDHQRWNGIVIHHLGKPAGDAESIHRLHQSFGYHGLGYHFLIGNGNGLGDGMIQVGYRWNLQQPGAHVAGEAGTHHNEHSIGICLIGNGERRPFSDAQITQVTRLVRKLQRQLDIPADRVFLHRNLDSQSSGPGRYFPAASFRQQLLNP